MFVRTLLLHFKEKSDGDDMVRHKSSKLKKHNDKSRNLLVEQHLQKARGVRTHWKCMRNAAIASTVLHGNNAVN